ERLAHGGVGHALAEVHEATGKRPQPAAGVDRAPGQQDSAVLLGNRASHDLGVEVEDEAAGAAHGLLPLVGRYRAAPQRAGAQRAEADGVRRQQAEGLVAHEVQSTPVALTLRATRCYNARASRPLERSGGSA